MKIIHVIENIDERYGGPAKSVPFLCKYLMKLGLETEIHSVSRYNNENNSIIEANNISWFKYKNTISNKLRYSPDLKAGIVNSIVPGKTIIHTHNQWNFPPFCANAVHRNFQLPIICSIRGSLYPWSLAQRKWIKKIFWFLFQKKILKNANCLHVTARDELEAVRSLGIKAPAAIIPNGVESIEFENLPEKKAAKHALNLLQNKKHILFMSRIHPKKGLDILIKCWAKLAVEFKNWQIVIAGPVGDKSYCNLLLETIKKEKIEESVHFIGMLDQKKRISAYAAADLFVLPSHSENFGIVIAEALAAGLPVITTRNTPWQDIEKKDYGWWIDLSSEKFESTLKSAMSTSKTILHQKGENGKKLVNDKYIWEIQAAKMNEVYKWLFHGNKPPGSVDLF
ncbi:glycosyltransferase [Lentisphaerota bacterium ZTH]|nr:glycosyltransferase [Lentisphaerota bacterium]WET05743.1 glycosyltransferase [Lentisphaerota bacterium ZTH]